MTLQNNFAKESPAKKPTRSGLQCVAKTDQGEQIKGWSGIPFDGCQTLPAKSRLAFWLFHCSLSKSQANEVAHALRWQSNESERNVITAFKDYIRVCQEARELIHLLFSNWEPNSLAITKLYLNCKILFIYQSLYEYLILITMKIKWFQIRNICGFFIALQTQLSQTFFPKGIFWSTLSHCCPWFSRFAKHYLIVMWLTSLLR